MSGFLGRDTSMQTPADIIARPSLETAESNELDHQKSPENHERMDVCERENLSMVVSTNAEKFYDLDADYQLVLATASGCKLVMPSPINTVTGQPERCFIEAMETFVNHPTMQCIFERIHAIDSTEDISMSLVPYKSIGYVYAAWNPLFGHLIKIGATMRSKPYIRVLEFSGTGVPEPFQLVASIPSRDPFSLEREIHSFYASARRYGKKKEFFLLSREEVIDQFHLRTLATQLNQETEHARTYRKSQPVDGKHRKQHPRLQTPEEKVAFDDSVEQFLIRSVQLSKRGNTTSKALKDAFGEENIPNERIFWRSLRSCITKIFPESVYTSAGVYKGIILTCGHA